MACYAIIYDYLMWQGMDAKIRKMEK